MGGNGWRDRRGGGADYLDPGVSQRGRGTGIGNFFQENALLLLFFFLFELLENVEWNICLFRQEADLVLGGDEGKECTYANGYLKRQAIFSCLTCTPDGNSGVCTACSLSCHDGHEVLMRPVFLGFRDVFIQLKLSDRFLNAFDFEFFS